MNKHPIATSVGVSTLVIATLTLGSRLVGLWRIRIFASTFGAGEVLDAYYAAFRIPDFLMGIFVVGTLSLAVLPVITQYTIRDAEEARRLVANLLNITFAGMFLLCGLTAILAPFLVRLVVPGFSEVATEQVVLLTRIILMAQVILSVGNMASAALNASRRFFWVGFSPMVYNLGLITGAVYLYPKYGMMGLGYGVLLGAVLHVTILLVNMWMSGFRFMPVLKIDAGIRSVLRLYWPRLLTFDLSLLSLIFASIFGSFLAPGSIAVYSLGFDLQAVPVGVIAFAIATASFTQLSEFFGKKDFVAYAKLLRVSIVRVAFYMLPISALLLLLRSHVVRILYGAGQFSWEDTRATFNVLGVLAFSLMGQSLVPLLSRALLSRLNTWTPVISNILSLVVTICTTVLLVPRFGILGVAWGYVAGVSFSAVFLYVWLRSVLIVEDSSVFRAEENVLIADIGKILFGTFVFASITYCSLFWVEPMLNTRTWLGLVLQSGFSTFTGGLAYMVIAYWLGLPDAQGLWQTVKRLSSKR